MKGLFEQSIWPNFTRPVIDRTGNDYGGRKFFSDAEKQRRHSLVMQKLKEKNCDLLIVQGYFPPSTMGVNTSLYWLGCDNYYKNTYTLILTKEGEFHEIHGVKTCDHDWRIDPYSNGEDMSPVLKGAKRIAYDGLGFITHAFYNYLQDICPGVELVDFCQELAFMRACKSEEELEAVRHTCMIQDRMFKSAALYIQPGRTINDIFADITRFLLILGGDPTEMPKILLAVGENRGVQEGDGILTATMAIPPDYRLKYTDYVVLTLETPGLGGYYAERSRYFFFNEPHSEIREHFEEALKLQEYQIAAYKNGMTMKELRDTLNAYKASVGAAQTHGNTWMDTEIRGMGNITVCRPLIQCDWEMFPLAKGMVFDSIHKYEKGHRCTQLHETVWMDDEKANIFGEYPQILTVL